MKLTKDQKEAVELLRKNQPERAYRILVDGQIDPVCAGLIYCKRNAFALRRKIKSMPNYQRCNVRIIEAG